MARTALLGAGVVVVAIGAAAAALAQSQTQAGPLSAGAPQGNARVRAAATNPRPEAGAEPRVLHRLVADFVEDEPGARVLAALEGEILAHEGRTWLRISASPSGPRVVPPPGAFGVAGSNRLTAEETAAGLADARLAVRAHGPRGTTEGRVVPGRARDVIERRLLPDGRVEHATVRFAAPSREVCFEVTLAGEGRHEVEVTLDGRTRIRATCRVRTGGARLERLASAGGHEGGRS